ncbi:MAG TPA: YeeE/YedE thiosulfate transporter family protein [Victivallales bacterium]|nr:YeeE/YedE thiosulfate transporter family protein [Victivallales bacterium]
MWNKLTSGHMSPWTTGILMALLFMLSLYLLNEPLGVLSSYQLLITEAQEIYNGYTPQLDGQELFIIGVFLGALIAAISGKNFKLLLFPEEHMSKGPSYYLTIGPVLSFLGGFLVMAGLIIAGNTFFKLWSDSLGLYMIVAVFIIIVFVESVVIGTILTIKVEDKKDK